MYHNYFAENFHKTTVKLTSVHYRSIVYIEFDGLSTPELSYVRSWVNFRMSFEDFMIRWNIPLCIRGQVHYLDYNWLLVYAWVLTLSGGTRFIARHLRGPFLEECWRVSRHFRNCRVYVGYGPAPGSRNKNGHVHFTRTWGARQYQGLYWAIASFLFVSQLDASWDS